MENVQHTRWKEDNSISVLSSLFAADVQNEVQVLDTHKYTSVTDALIALNTEVVEPASFCGVFSKRKRAFFLLWSSEVTEQEAKDLITRLSLSVAARHLREEQKTYNLKDCNFASNENRREASCISEASTAASSAVSSPERTRTHFSSPPERTRKHFSSPERKVLERKAESSHVESGIPEMTPTDAGLDMRNKLSHGNQSSVHVAVRTTTGDFCCIKRFCKASITKSSLAFMIDEYEVMREVGWHPRLTQAYRMFQDSSFFYIELALYRGGDFSGLKQNALTSGLSCNEVWWKTVFHQAMQGLAHLHKHEYIHCDVKESNLMLKTTKYHEPEVVLIDFGVVQAASAKRTAVFGTPGYIAPEVWDEKAWTPQGDAFSLGVVILQMLTDRFPSSDHPRRGIFIENTESFKDVKFATQTREPDVSSLPEGVGTRLRQLIESLLGKDPAKRPTVSEALLFLETDIEHE